MMGKWTIEDMPSQAGRIALVTGANSGLGFYTSRALALKGALVLMACRNPDTGEQARQRILAQGVDHAPELWSLDLASLDSVRTLARQVLEKHGGVDLLINNAGLMAIPYLRTREGFEMQFGVNHLGHFALTALLWPGIVKRTAPRIVSLSSLAHRFGSIRFGDLHWERGYKKWAAYGMSKLANLLFIRELTRQLEEASLPVLAAAAHPGYANTALQSKGMHMAGSAFGARLFDQANALVAQSAEMGALPTLYAATAPEVRQGGYYGPDGRLRLKGYPSLEIPNPRLVNDIVARELWTISEELCGVSFRPA